MRVKVVAKAKGDESGGDMVMSLTGVWCRSVESCFWRDVSKGKKRSKRASCSSLFFLRSRLARCA